MKSVISVILLAVCVGVFFLVRWLVFPRALPLTIDEIAGKWVMDIEATMPLHEAHLRQELQKCGMEAKDIPAAVATFKADAAHRCYEFTGKTVSMYDEQDGVQTNRVDIRVAGLTTYGREIFIHCRFDGPQSQMAMRRCGDLLVMEMEQLTDMDVERTFVLKRPATTANPPASAPAPKP